MNTTIELARDAATGHVLLTPEQAAAVARWYIDAPDARADDCEIAHAIGGVDLTASVGVALARYVLRVAPVVAAAVRQTEAEAEMNREDAIGSPWSQAAARKRRNDATDTLIAAVRAAGLATEVVTGGSGNHWTEAEAVAAGDVELPRCIHGQPRNVFCGRCES